MRYRLSRNFCIAAIFLLLAGCATTRSPRIITISGRIVSYDALRLPDHQLMYAFGSPELGTVSDSYAKIGSDGSFKIFLNQPTYNVYRFAILGFADLRYLFPCGWVMFDIPPEGCRDQDLGDIYIFEPIRFHSMEYKASISNLELSWDCSVPNTSCYDILLFKNRQEPDLQIENILEKALKLSNLAITTTQAQTREIDGKRITVWRTPLSGEYKLEIRAKRREHGNLAVVAVGWALLTLENDENHLTSR